MPPITATSPNLPDDYEEIVIELRKQESLLSQIHAEMNAGYVTKKREEQLWEVQRIITQLKRKLRAFDKKPEMAQKSVDDQVDGDISSTEFSGSLSLSAQHSTAAKKTSGSDDDSNHVNPANISVSLKSNTGSKTSPQVCISVNCLNSHALYLLFYYCFNFLGAEEWIHRNCQRNSDRN